MINILSNKYTLKTLFFLYSYSDYQTVRVP